MISNPFVVVIILNYGKLDLTIKCLNALKLNDYHRFSVVVINNHHSNTETENFVMYFKDLSATRLNDFDGNKDLYNKVYYHIEETNIGYAAANNLGMKFAFGILKANYVWILNNDTSPYPDAINMLVLAANKNVNTGLIGANIFHENGEIQALGGSRFYKYFGLACPIKTEEKLNNLDCIIGAAVLVSKRFYEEVGPMDERYFLYFEEIDWAIRGRDLNFKLAYAKGINVTHIEGASTSIEKNKNFRSPIPTYYGTRSRILLIKKFFPYLLFNVLVINILLGLKAFLMLDFKKFVYTIWGTIDGLKGLVGIKKEMHKNYKR
jgi:GT2 family glycosyltransferase